MQTDLIQLLGEDPSEKLNRPTEQARGLPASAYLDDEFFELEQERLFRGGWMSVAFAHEIPSPGDALPVNVAGVEIIVLRDEHGRIRALHNVCRHRASTVLAGPAKGLSVLRCPYHSWTYNLDGTLKRAPYWDGTPTNSKCGLPAEDTALAVIRCEQWQDIVFVNLSDTAATLEEYVAPLQQLLEGYELTDLPVYDHIESTIAANWKVVMEGLLEVYHEQYVHDFLSHRIDAQGAATWEDTMVDDIIGLRSVVPDDVDDHPPSTLPRIPGMPLGGTTPTYIFLLFPCTSINVLDNHVLRTIWTPVSRTQTRWRSAVYFSGDTTDTPECRMQCDEIVEFWKTVRREDLEMVLSVQKGLQSRGPKPTNIRFSAFWEKVLQYFHQHVLRRLNEGES